MEISHPDLDRHRLTSSVFEEDPLLSMLTWLMDQLMKSCLNTRKPRQ